MRKLLCVLTALFTIAISAQDLDKKWQFDAITSIKGEKLFKIDSLDYLTFNKGIFNYELAAKNNLKASGSYIHQNNVLVFYYDTPKDTIRKYNITQLTDSTLVFTEKGVSYKFRNSKNTAKIVPGVKSEEIAQVPNQGLSLEGILRGVFGIAIILGIAILLSSNKKRIPWRLVGLGLLVQIILAVSILHVPAIQWLFDQVSNVFIAVLDFTRAGSVFLLGDKLMDVNSVGFVFLFQILPTVIFFSALTSVFFYLGILQKIVQGLAWLMTKALGISGSESLAVAGNIFLGQTEAPLMIKAYLDKMNASEVFLVMVGGMSTLAGGVLAAYIDLLGGGSDEARQFFAKQLLMASIMAAPGAIVIAKILVPQTEEIMKNVKVSAEKIGTNLLDAISIGTTEGLKLAANVGAMLLVFVALIAMVNGILGWIGDFTTINNAVASSTEGKFNSLSLEYILGTLFSPLAWASGVSWNDAPLVGRLLGEKLIASEFIAYNSLTNLKGAGAFVEAKSIVISTFMLSGFANFASIGIQIGGIGSLAPPKRELLSKFGFKAMIGGMLASLLSATIAGMIIG